MSFVHTDLMQDRAAFLLATYIKFLSMAAASLPQNWIYEVMSLQYGLTRLTAVHRFTLLQLGFTNSLPIKQSHRLMNVQKDPPFSILDSPSSISAPVLLKCLHQYCAFSTSHRFLLQNSLLSTHHDQLAFRERSRRSSWYHR